MKKMINGKKYDTETAALVGGWDNNRQGNDLYYCSERIYKKRTGEYFLFGSGNAMSKYRTYSGDNSWGGGEQIMPLSYDAARKWAEEHLPADEYEAEFGTVSEDDTETVMTIRLPSFAADAIRKEAAKTGKIIGEVVAGLAKGLMIEWKVICAGNCPVCGKPTTPDNIFMCAECKKKQAEYEKNQMEGAKNETD